MSNTKHLWDQLDHHRDLLAEHYRPMVEREAKRIHAKLPKGTALADLIEDGTHGLDDAIRQYDRRWPISFARWAPKVIRGAIRQGVECRYVAEEKTGEGASKTCYPKPS